MPLTSIIKFLKLETSSALVLFVSAIVALITCNTDLGASYQIIWQTPLVFQAGSFTIAHTPMFYVNEALMTLFFLLVALELKREFLEGELSDFSQALLPGVAALGGMVVPAGIYWLFNSYNSVTAQGWAIPVATDIAFALGVLALFGRRIPISLKLFLMALAIFDDIGAILIIAFSQSQPLILSYLLLAACVVIILFIFNRLNLSSLPVYLLLGMLCWYGLLKAGLHPTIAGVILAFMIPLNTKQYSPLKTLEMYLHPWVAYFVMPLFAFANAGVALNEFALDTHTSTILIGIVCGLFFGKQIGVLGFTWLLVKFKLAKLPKGITWLEIYGVAILCGIGFTMSLFLGTLAFQGNNPSYLIEVRLGVLLGSLLSGIVGASILHIALERKKAKNA